MSSYKNLEPYGNAKKQLWRPTSHKVHCFITSTNHITGKSYFYSTCTIKDTYFAYGCWIKPI